MNARRATLLAVLAIAASLLGVASATAAPSPSPWWGVRSGAVPGSLKPGLKGTLIVTATNIGDAAASGPVTIVDRLPAGVSAQSVSLHSQGYFQASSAGGFVRNFGTDLGPKGPQASLELCSFTAQRVTCTWPGVEELQAKGLSKTEAEAQFRALTSYIGRLELLISVKAASSGIEPGPRNEVAVSGGGAPPSTLSRPLAIAAAEEEPTFGVEDYEFLPEAEGGALDTEAGSHPFQLTTFVSIAQNGEARPLALPKDLSFPLPAGLAGRVAELPQCTLARFSTEAAGAESVGVDCPPKSALGVSSAVVSEALGNGGIHDVNHLSTLTPAPVYNLTPAFGEPARFGFDVGGIPIVLDTSLRSGLGEDYGVTVSISNLSQAIGVFSDELTFWGIPGDPLHDASRGGACLLEVVSCTPLAEAHPTAFLTMPTSCPGTPFEAAMSARSWLEGPLGPYPSATYTLTGEAGEPLPLEACNRLGFAPRVDAEPTSDAATSPTGLNFDLSVEDEGLTSPAGAAQSQIKKATVTLPQGFTANPSLAEGLGVCTEAQFEAETAGSQPGEGCPNAAKIGDVEAESPLVEGKVTGSLYVAKQTDNPFHSLLALYMVLRNPELGVLVRAAGKVEPNKATGQLTTTFDYLPQLPISHFRLSFRQGQRAPLITPPACGTYTVKADLYPWSEPQTPLHRESSFRITAGPEGLGCPSGGVPPLHPVLEAGTLNNRAGSYSPFYTRISRKDSEQEITHFSIKLPPGVIGKLAGIPECPDAAIAGAKAREHEGGAAEEEVNPSCPAASVVGRSLVGSGVGNVLAYAPGKIYLAGPYHGSALSLAAITAARVGPFDLGTVVVRFALRVNPETAEVFVDATGSDPIPHIIQGIPVHLRDIRAYVDRPNFVLNPTSCERTSTASTVLGSGLNFASEADDQPITVTSPFQAADCASLGFAPKLALSLKGGTKRGKTPAFKAVLTYPKGSYANIREAQVTLPHSEFLEQSHIKTICTRVQFAAGGGNGEQCPAASIYGKAKAVTPLLDEPLSGPVFLRSSSHNLPDLVAALHNGQIAIDLDGHIDSVKGGRIRNTFEAVPDAPVTKFTLEMQGGKKGLLVNSTNLCKSTNRAIADFTGQNGKVHNFNPAVKPQCGKKSKKGHHKRGAR